jgi:membrane-bound lytic murein transglycosylase F
MLAPHPAFGDLDAVRERGTLRVITRIDNPNYFVREGRPAGFEYELVQAFARAQGLDVEVLVADDDTQALQWLRAGGGDIVTARVRTTQVARDSTLASSTPYFHSASVVVGRIGTDVADIAALAGKRIAVVANSAQHQQLSSLLSRGLALELVLVSPSTPFTFIADAVENWSVDAAVVDAYVVADLRARHPLLKAGVSLPDEIRYQWTARARDRQLLAAANLFLRETYASNTYRVLAARYFEHPRWSALGAFERLSPYDDLVRRYADSYDFDWRLIVALMYRESRFDPRAVSPGGAQGLMQLTPATAQALGVRNPFDPAAGIRGGVRYLDALRARFDPRLPPRERTWFALAAYHVGIKRVELARTRAAASGLDPTRWFGGVETAMRRMGGEYRDGRCHQTIEYVRAIRSLYNAYHQQKEVLSALMDGTTRG